MESEHLPQKGNVREEGAAWEMRKRERTRRCLFSACYRALEGEEGKEGEDAGC